MTQFLSDFIRTNIIRNMPGLVLALFLTFGVTHEGFGQVKKGQRLMEEGRYGEAIRFLKKDFDPSKPNPNTALLLAKSYYQIHEYDEARDMMDIAGKNAFSNPDDLRFYADVLIANDDFSAAYLLLIELLSTNESDLKTVLWLDKTTSLLAWDSITTGTMVGELTGANTVYNEYAPYVALDDELWFVTDAISMQALFPAAYSDQNIHLFYKTKMREDGSNRVNKPTMLLKNRKYYFHDGPISAWPGQNKYAITLRDLEGPISGARVGIYFTSLSGKEEDMLPFKYNQMHNTGHPTFSNDGTRMYFASDRPGGFGQMDIWFCDWIDGNWSEPRNMGPFVNTTGNEVFTRYFEDRLYFSSDRNDMGYGGLDLYYVSEIRGFDDIYNLRAPINSAYDDFGVSFVNYNHGYFASNRPLGAGGDDIYRLSFFVEQPLHDLRIARITNENIPPGTMVQILDKSGRLVQTTKVNDRGEIEMYGLKSREQYTLKVVDETIRDIAKLALLTISRETEKTFQQNAAGEFQFVLLEPGVYEMKKEEDNEDLSVMQYDLKGKIVTQKKHEFGAATISVTNQAGVEVGRITPASNGDFEFKGLRMDEIYRLQTNDIDVPHEMDIIGKSGVVVQSIRPVGNNSFTYTRTAPAAAWMTNAEIVVPQVFAVQIGKDLSADTKLILYDGNGAELYPCDINEDEFIALGNLTTGKAYKLSVSNQELDWTDRLVILDGSGDTSQTVRPSDSNNYIFEYMIYDGYGMTEATDIVSSVKSVEKPEIFKGKLRDYKLPGGHWLLLTDVNDNFVDTIRPLDNGTFTMRNLDRKRRYRLATVGRPFDSEKTLQVFNKDNKLLAENPRVDSYTFEFGLIDKEDVALVAVANEDESILKFSLWGKLLDQNSGTAPIRLRLFDENDTFLMESYTTGNNEFAFTDLKPASKFVIKTEIVDEKVKLVARRSSGYDSLVVQIESDRSFILNFDREGKILTAATDLKVSPGDKFELPSVYYNFNSFELLEASKSSLNQLAVLLQNNPELKIEIQSHTDSRGPEAYNLTLSQRRAESVSKYLATKNIDAKRLQAVGFGEKERTNKCADGVRCTESEHARNRRTTFVVRAN